MICIGQQNVVQGGDQYQQVEFFFVVFVIFKLWVGESIGCEVCQQYQIGVKYGVVVNVDQWCDVYCFVLVDELE